MKRTKRKQSAGRLSRTPAKVINDLRGLSAKAYYAHKGMTAGLHRRIRESMPNNLWIRLDRGRFLTEGQQCRIAEALNRVMVNDPNWPYSWPDITVAIARVNGRLQTRLSVEVITMPKEPGSDGTLYFPLPEHPKTLVSAGGFTGHVGFSSHAIDQMISRSDLRETTALLRGPTVISEIMSIVLKEGAVERGAHGPCLVIKTKDGKTLGYLPIKRTSLSDRSLWVCKTCLDPDMRGTPES